MNCINISGLMTQVFIMTIYIINVFVCNYIADNTYLNNTTVYTQALNDWSQQPWVDFVWNPDGKCPSDYEPISALWSGTHHGNVTSWQTLVLVPDDSRYDHDVESLPPKA